MKSSLQPRGNRFAAAIANFLAPLAEAQRAQREFLNSPAGQRVDGRALAVLLLTPLLLTLREYAFGSHEFERCWQALAPWLPASWQHALFEWLELPVNRRLASLLYWCLGQALVYFAIPAIVIKLCFRQSLAEYGWKVQGAARGWPWYALMLAGMVPAVWLAAQRESFLHTYPFFRPERGEPLWPRFLLWEAAYALQFVVLEFFFRGFMLHGLKRSLGAYAIFVMTIPYCLIHFAKPWPETLGAIAAGVALGYMSLRTRSIWLGAALHIAVAWSMDALAWARWNGLLAE